MAARSKVRVVLLLSVKPASVSVSRAPPLVADVPSQRRDRLPPAILNELVPRGADPTEMREPP